MQKSEMTEQHLYFKPLEEDKRQILADLKRQLRQIKEELARLRLIGEELASVRPFYAEA